jgi:hypothetical protein
VNYVAHGTQRDRVHIRRTTRLETEHVSR